MKIKFPVIPDDIEYLDVIKKREVVLTLNNKDIAGLKWRELQLLIGSKINSGIYHYTMKIASKEENYLGTIRAINFVTKTETNQKDLTMENEIKKLTEKVNNLNSKGSDFSTELLITITKQSYETQINFLNQQLKEKDRNLDELKREIEKLNDELDKADDVIEELKSKTGINQYLDLLKPFLLKQAGSLKAVTNLKDSNPSDIPVDIIQILGLVDWNEIDPDNLNQIIEYLKIFIQKLPLKK